jgi:hypothetical protein
MENRPKNSDLSCSTSYKLKEARVLHGNVRADAKAPWINFVLYHNHALGGSTAEKPFRAELLKLSLM